MENGALGFISPFTITLIRLVSSNHYNKGAFIS